MPLVNHLEFTGHSLSVAYKASPTPQELLIAIETTGTAGFPSSSNVILDVAECINAGAAGSADFHPTVGSCEILDEPLDPSGPSYTFRLLVAGVSPVYVRTIVEKLRAVGWDEVVTSMSIAGSLPLDGTPMSVREAHVRAWLDDASAYPVMWPEVPFALKSTYATGAGFCVVPQGPLNAAVKQELEALAVRWLNAVSEYVDTDGDYVPVEFDSKYLPTFGRTRTEFRAAYERFRHTLGPSRAALVNMFIRFHFTVAPLAEVEISL